MRKNKRFTMNKKDISFNEKEKKGKIKYNKEKVEVKEDIVKTVGIRSHLYLGSMLEPS